MDPNDAQEQVRVLIKCVDCDFDIMACMCTCCTCGYCVDNACACLSREEHEEKATVTTNKVEDKQDDDTLIKEDGFLNLGALIRDAQASGLITQAVEYQ